jgi:hypothetical protein
MSDTPRTDAETYGSFEKPVVSAYLARTLERELAARDAEVAQLRSWLDNNTMFMEVDHSFTFEEIDAMPNVPVLASVSKRIWYHATDDTESGPFSRVIDAALAQPKEPT